MTGVLTQKKRFDLKIKEMRAGQAKDATMFNDITESYSRLAQELIQRKSRNLSNLPVQWGN